jgi:hypothetical protein
VLGRTLRREDERGKKRGHNGDGAPFIGDAAGGWGMGRRRCHTVVRCGGSGASAAVERRGVIGSSPAAMLTGGT